MVVIVFRSRLRDGVGEAYGPVAARMQELASRAPGFVSIKTFTAEDGERVSIVEFDSADDAIAWRKDPEHLEAQRLGRERFYEAYRIQVCAPMRDYVFEREADPAGASRPTTPAFGADARDLGVTRKAPMDIRAAEPGDLDPILALLEGAALPTTGVGDHWQTFLVAWADDALVGVCGLEIHGRVGLLRSVAVEQAHRGHGLASLLCDRLESRATARGLDALYLLTTTAEGFFARRGYVTIPRAEAPPEIHATEEFERLCPESAAVMWRRLDRGEVESATGS